MESQRTNINTDLKLEKSFIASLSDLSTYDNKEAKALVEQFALTEQDFCYADNWHCYCAVAACVRAAIPANSDNVHRELQKVVADRAASVLLAAFSEPGEGYYAQGYATQVVEASDRRRTEKLLDDSLRAVKSGSDVKAARFKLINSLQTTRGRQQTKGLDQYVESVERHIQANADGTAKPVIPWYLPQLDSAIGGLQPTLILIGAEPGVGKSALLASAVHKQAERGHRPFVASLEDEPSWLAWRLVSKEADLNQFDLRFNKVGKGTLKEIKECNEKNRQLYERIRLVDGSTAGMRIEDLISSVNDAIVNEGCDSVWIDHLGEIVLTQSDRTDMEIARHLSLLRGVANRHGVPVIVAAHFKRTEDPSKAPTFRDFANSSGSERKARVALGLRRQPGSDVLDVHVMKQTNGPAGGLIQLRFEGAAAMIVDSEG